MYYYLFQIKMIIYSGKDTSQIMNYLIEYIMLGIKLVLNIITMN